MPADLSADDTTESRPGPLLYLLEDADSLYGVFGGVQANVEDEPCADHSDRESSEVNPRCGELLRESGYDARLIVSLDSHRVNTSRDVEAQVCGRGDFPIPT